MEKAVAGVVLAGGRSERFGELKQFVTIDGTRLVDRAVRLVSVICRPVMLVLPDGIAWTGPTVDAVVTGGSTRVESLRNAIRVLPSDTDIVVVHDSVRPLATIEVLERAVAAIRNGADAAVPIWVPNDVIKHVRGDGTLEHVGREGFAVAQSPSAYRYSTLFRALASLTKPVPSEESEAVERVGGRVVGVRGDRWSQHVVEPRDLQLLARLMAP
jgi:2-C-methyl-D-erythritol 4-phosphate cytidylyltransferase